MNLTTDSGPIVLGRTISSAGEGLVAEVVDRPDLAVKVYHALASGAALLSVNNNPERRLAKVAVMIDFPPPARAQADGHVVLAWPEEIVYENGVAVGYTMPRIEWTRTMELHELVKIKHGARVPAHIPQWAPSFAFRNRVHTAINLCRAVEVAHSTGAIIGDFNERNILVDSTARVSLVDTDSMQFTSPEGELYTCDVGHRDYTAPELVGLPLSTTRRGPETDWFALAIHIHRLLLEGLHPFLGGEWTGGGDRPAAIDFARRGFYVGGPKSPLVATNRYPDPERLPTPVRRLFDKAFRVGATRPLERPTPADWVDVLEKLRARTP
ncbi:hypothetical protein QT381_12350 [Galbitalea sp. SE-J8]|uniref:protein kinase domain-containing protein n=1 Tax=Galbitalea sp. SE-J8 TaxID=3054952 RepID=UPI00259CF80E|nr:hypothetical protein [Galbitalea sp. SE-J8]MDM4763798.1 hypothetical protein [Galbitalea sp. SE-J8]